MQRGIINKVYIKYFVLSALFLYDSIAVIYSFMPPLFGIISLYLYQAFDEDDRYFIFYMVVFLMFFEANRHFLLFSTTLFLVISYFYLIPKLRSITICKKCLYPLYISISYIGYFIFNVIISFILNIDYFPFDIIIIYYILIEIIIALVWL